MLEKLINMLKGLSKKEKNENTSKDMAKERLHLVLMQDRANVSADFLELMKQEIIEVIKKYIEIDEKEIDVRLTTKSNDDGTKGAPALYANIPIINVRNDIRKEYAKNIQKENKDNIEIQTTQMNEEKLEIVKEENIADMKKERQEENNSINEIQNNNNYVEKRGK